MSKIIMIAAVDKNGGLGYKNELLFTDPLDFKHFKNTTTGHIIVMGRKTFESIGKPLPNRINVVLSTDVNYAPKEVIVVSDLIELLDVCITFKNKDVYIIGGGLVYDQFKNKTDSIILTRFDTSAENIDTYFPISNDELESDFKLTRTLYLKPNIKVEYYDRKSI